jgi:hypothetical protein
MKKLLLSLSFFLLAGSIHAQELPSVNGCDSSLRVSWSRHARSYHLADTKIQRKEAERRLKMFPSSAQELHLFKKKERIGSVVFCTSLGLLLASKLTHGPSSALSDQTSNILFGTAIAGIVVSFPFIRSASSHHRKAFDKYNQEICGGR